MTAYETLLLERDSHIATIKLNRVEKHNAINGVMARELIDCLDGLEGDDGIRVIILTGAGDRAFCAGADMGEVALAADADQQRDWPARAAARLGQVRKPVIAAVNGYAYGGGAVFATHCDIRICSDTASFRFVGASYGLVVGASRLPGIVGAPMAKDLIFTARTVHADEALRIGLANRVVPPAGLATAVREMADAIAANSPPAVAASKEVIDIVAGTGPAVKREIEHNLVLRETEEHRQRFRSAAERVLRQD